MREQLGFGFCDHSADVKELTRLEARRRAALSKILAGQGGWREPGIYGRQIAQFRRCEACWQFMKPPPPRWLLELEA